MFAFTLERTGWSCSTRRSSARLSASLPSRSARRASPSTCRACAVDATGAPSRAHGPAPACPQGCVRAGSRPTGRTTRTTATRTTTRASALTSRPAPSPRRSTSGSCETRSFASSCRRGPRSWAPSSTRRRRTTASTWWSTRRSRARGSAAGSWSRQTGSHARAKTRATRRRFRP